MNSNPYQPLPIGTNTDAPNLPPNPTSKPKQSIDLLSATTIVAASMIGAGVYTTSGFTLGDLGHPGWVVMAWLVAGMIAICGAACYGALASEFADSGGEYLFLSRAVHPIAGLMAGWVSILAGFTGAIAFAATTFDEYSNLPLAGNGIAIGLVVLAAVMHSVGVKFGARVQDAAVIKKVLWIVVFIAIAFFSDWPRDPVAERSAALPMKTGFAFALSFATALMWISLSYSGFNAAVYVASEVRDPKRNVPRALLLGTVGVTLIYVLLNTFFVYAPPSSAIVGNPQVATAAAQSIGGDWLENFVRIVILFGLFTSVSALMMTGPRVYAKMADDGFLPKIFRFQGDVPVASIWIQATLAIVVIYFSSLKSLLGYLGFTLSVSAALTAGLVFWLHNRESSSVHVRLFPLPPMIFVGGTLLTATLAAIQSPTQALVGLATIGFGILMYPLYRRRQLRG